MDRAEVNDEVLRRPQDPATKDGILRCTSTYVPMQKDKIAEQLNRDWTDNEISFMPFGAVLSAPCIRNTGYWA